MQPVTPVAHPLGAWLPPAASAVVPPPPRALPGLCRSRRPRLFCGCLAAACRRPHGGRPPAACLPAVAAADGPLPPAAVPTASRAACAPPPAMSPAPRSGRCRLSLMRRLPGRHRCPCRASFATAPTAAHAAISIALCCRCVPAAPYATFDFSRGPRRDMRIHWGRHGDSAGRCGVVNEGLIVCCWGGWGADSGCVGVALGNAVRVVVKG